jgi:prevent-host-death family protein
MISTLSSREFNQDTSRAKKVAEQGPVFITDRGRPAHVLMTIEEYRRLTETPKNILELLDYPEANGIDFEIPVLGNDVYKPFDLS